MVLYLGVTLILIAIVVFYFGIKRKEAGYGIYVSKVRYLGAALLLAMMGIFLIKSPKSFKEIFSSNNKMERLNELGK